MTNSTLQDRAKEALEQCPNDFGMDYTSWAEDNAKLIGECLRLAADPWMPIETAPRDGTRIQAYFPITPHDEKIQIVRHTTNVYEPIDNWTTDAGESACCSFDPPTHWMPLPAAPVATTESKP